MCVSLRAYPRLRRGYAVEMFFCLPPLRGDKRKYDLSPPTAFIVLNFFKEFAEVAIGFSFRACGDYVAFHSRECVIIGEKSHKIQKLAFVKGIENGRCVISSRHSGFISFRFPI